MTCANCGIASTAPKTHVCMQAISEWIGRWASHAPALAALTVDDLKYFQLTGQHLWRPDQIRIS